METKVVCVIAMAFMTGATGRLIAQTQFEMNEEACSKFKKADAELNRAYQQILATKAMDADFLRAFRQAQRAWLSFRDAHVRSIFPDPDPRAYGTVYPMCRCVLLEQLTTERTKEIQHLWIEGLEEGEVCGGSCKVKARQ